MAQARFYIYDKITKEESVVGEYQLPFNMGLTLDESKDSCKVIILSNRKQYIEPYTICRLEGFDDLWWIVKKDSVQRHDNDFGFLYEHRLSLEGAIELLNARDLTSCGFNTERYDIWSFISRLFSLSDFEFSRNFNFNNVLNPYEKVTYLKTFENYTLGSALKEFLNGYNCIPKLRFYVNNGVIANAIVDIHSKKGLNESPIDISHFDDTNETSNIDSESYATRVISNVQNCVNSKLVRYPNIGACKLVGDNGEVTFGNCGQAKILLPSPAYYVDSITFYTNASVRIEYDGEFIDDVRTSADDVSRKGLKLRTEILARLSVYATDEELQDLQDLWEDIFATLRKNFAFELKNGGYYNILDANSPYVLPYLSVRNINNTTPVRLYLNNERYNYNNDGQYNFTLTWKQNSNEIKGFGFYVPLQRERPDSNVYDMTNFIVATTINANIGKIKIRALNSSVKQSSNLFGLLDKEVDDGFGEHQFLGCLYSVNYIPMNDLKLKSDNHKEYNDSKLYNQNGKLVDSYAVSKLINGYCESISNGEINKTRKYYKYYDIPSLGKIVKNGNDNFVISNISIDVYDNDNNFVYDCDFTLNVYSSCKSTMISANTSIRDYDCPQENNIKRTQLYRDYVEFSYNRDSNATNRFIDYDYANIINSNSLGLIDNITCVLKATDTSFVNEGDSNSHNYYYKLDITRFSLEKKVVLCVDFNDNNIIGYGNRQVNKPFQLSNLFDNQRLITIPISYVDSVGELDQVELSFEETYILENAFGNYVDPSRTCAISGDIYRYCKNNSIITINEQNYNKDGLEVPVFLYSLEINGDVGIEIANDILDYDKDFDAFVCVVEENLNITNENQAIIYENAEAVIQCNIATYDTSRALVVTLVGTIINLKGKSIGVWAIKDGNARFVMAFNNYPNNSNIITCYRNFYKLN